MLEKIKQILTAAVAEIGQAKDLAQLDLLKAKYLGKKSEIQQILNALRNLSNEERPRVGQAVNQARDEIVRWIEEKRAAQREVDQKDVMDKEAVDVTLPARGIKCGRRHPLTMVLEEVKTIFKEMGYVVAEGPEIETEYHNFEALNIPPFHPARDMHDTFYLKSGEVLRTHTSPVQIRYMEKHSPPFAIIAPGRVYRRDADVTHSAVFHQVEGLLVDAEVSFADLKGTLTYFLHQFFGKNRRVRFRPSYFPFTEPSAEVDVECIMCGGKGCRVCKDSGWLEVLGAGLVDPNVFRAVNYDVKKVSGFAFGMGIERLAMLKYGIHDIRLFFENRVHFLSQF